MLEGEDLSDEVREWIRDTVETTVSQFTDSEFTEDWDLEGLVTAMQSLYATDITADELREEINVTDRDALTEEFVEDGLETYDEREQALGLELAREVERFIIPRPSTCAGASTSRRWTTSARASTSARSRRRIRSSSTAARGT